jgi:hypothetical protein
MIKISKEMADLCSSTKGFGIIVEQGAVVGDAEFIVYINEDIPYLAHISEFEQSGVLIRLKEILDKEHDLELLKEMRKEMISDDIDMEIDMENEAHLKRYGY